MGAKPCGIPGNEKVDDETKEAAKSPRVVLKFSHLPPISSWSSFSVLEHYGKLIGNHLLFWKTPLTHMDFIEQTHTQTWNYFD